MSPLDRELEQALARQADGLAPPADLLGGVQRRAGRLRRQRRLVASGAAAAVLALIVAIPVALRDDRRDVGGPVGQPTPSSSTAPSVVPSTPAPESVVPVYFLDDTERGPRLYREWHLVAGGAMPAAVERMMQPPLDRDYFTPWPAGTKVLRAELVDGVWVVDLSREALGANLGAEAAEMALQQLVHTVTGTASIETERNGTSRLDEIRVQLLVQGEPVTDLWGHVDASKPMTRGTQLDVLGRVWIDAPAEGEQIAPTFTMSGTASVFEATVSLRVRRGCDPAMVCDASLIVYLEDFTTADNGAPERGTWTKQVTLPPAAVAAEWLVVEAFESSAENGEAQYIDSKLVRVRPASSPT